MVRVPFTVVTAWGLVSCWLSLHYLFFHYHISLAFFITIYSLFFIRQARFIIAGFFPFVIHTFFPFIPSFRAHSPPHLYPILVFLLYVSLPSHFNSLLFPLFSPNYETWFPLFVRSNQCLCTFSSSCCCFSPSPCIQSCYSFVPQLVPHTLTNFLNTNLLYSHIEWPWSYTDASCLKNVWGARAFASISLYQSLNTS